jgi:hypothetical protein
MSRDWTKAQRHLYCHCECAQYCCLVMIHNSGTRIHTAPRGKWSYSHAAKLNRTMGRSLLICVLDPWTVTEKLRNRLPTVNIDFPSARFTASIISSLPCRLIFSMQNSNIAFRLRSAHDSFRFVFAADILLPSRYLLIAFHSEWLYVAASF